MRVYKYKFKIYIGKIYQCRLLSPNYYNILVINNCVSGVSNMHLAHGYRMYIM